MYRVNRDLFLAQRFARHVSPLTTTICTLPSDAEMFERVRTLSCQEIDWVNRPSDFAGSVHLLRAIITRGLSALRVLRSIGGKNLMAAASGRQGAE